MSRGPAPTPSPILAARGSWRAKAREKKGEPRAGGKLICPRGVPADVAKIWTRTVARLQRMRVGGEVDTDLLLVYCRTLAESDQVEEQLAKQGLFVTVFKRGKARGEKIPVSIPHPLLRRRDKLREAVLRLAQQFGFSPASRARVQVEPVQSANPLEEFLKPTRN